MFVNVVFYDDQTGQVISDFAGDDSLIGPHIHTAHIPQGVVMDDVRAWKVDLATLQLVNTGREPEREEINAERDRRIAAGFPFAGKVIQFRPEDKQRITGAGALAGFAIAQGAKPGDVYWADPDEPMEWITADNSVLPLDAHTAFAMAQAAAKHEKRHVFVAKKLKVQPRPMDYASDHHWPDYDNG